MRGSISEVIYMKIVAVYGSARKNGYSAKMVTPILEKIQKNTDEIVKFALTKMNIKPSDDGSIHSYLL